ncbi:MAG: hypothetical protein ACRDKL_01520 [Solirubrobacteraceae bacterium]
MQIEIILGDLIDEATSKILSANLGGDRIQKKGSRDGLWQNLKTASGSWVEARQGNFYIAVLQNESEAPSPEGRCAEVQVGLWVPSRQFDLLWDDPAFMKRVEQLEVFDTEDRYISTSEPLSTFVTDAHDETLQSQAERVAEWAIPQLAGLLTLDPGRADGEDR